MKRQLFLRVVHSLFQPIRRIGEVDRPLRIDDRIVRAVESLAFESIGERHVFGLGIRPIGIEPRDAAIAVLAQNQAALAIEGQAVGARFAAAWIVARVAGWFEEQLDAIFRVPPHEGVVGNIGAQQEVAVANPDWAFAPGHALANDLDLRIERQQLIERRVEPFNASDGRRRAGFSSGDFASMMCEKRGDHREN